MLYASFARYTHLWGESIGGGPGTAASAGVDITADLHSDPEASWQASLVQRCLDGDERAFEQLVQHYSSLLLRTAFLLVDDEEAAKDIVQDSFVLAWKHMDRLRDPAALRAWLLKIVVNQSTSLKRQLARKSVHWREQLHVYFVDARAQQNDFERGKIEEELDLAEAIGKLPLDQRAVLVLFYYHRMTMPEIATTLGVAENTLRKRLRAALEKIRRLLQLDERFPRSPLPASEKTEFDPNRRGN